MDGERAVRLFTALALPEPVCRSLTGALTPARGAEGGPRWTDPALWHLTVVFLGEVEPRRLDRLGPRLRAAAASVPAFALELAGVGTFPGRGRPQVLWAGVRGDLGSLAALARASRRAARRAGVPVERRPYHPHVTLGRWQRGDRASRTVLEHLDGYAGPAFPVGEVLLVRSHPGASASHERLETYPLGS